MVVLFDVRIYPIQDDINPVWMNSSFLPYIIELWIIITPNPTPTTYWLDGWDVIRSDAINFDTGYCGIYRIILRCLSFNSLRFSTSKMNNPFLVNSSIAFILMYFLLHYGMTKKTGMVGLMYVRILMKVSQKPQRWY